MGDSNETSQKLEESAAVELTGRIMVVSIIVLFVVIALVVFLHVYAKWYWRHAAQRGNTIITRRRRRMDFAGEMTAATALRGHGLDPSFLKTIPIILFSPQDFKDGLECSVCLSEVTQGEKTRILPKCNHGFHVQCIDMWFHSHSTCPICRNPIQNSNPDQLSPQGITHNTPQAADDYSSNAAAATVLPTEALSFPTNILYWGNEVQVSTLRLQDDNDDDVTSSQQVSSTLSSSPTSTATSSDNMGGDGHYLVIEIPRQTNEEEDQKSPVLSRLMSLKRLLSRDRKINPFTPSSSVDVEQAATSQN